MLFFIFFIHLSPKQGTILDTFSKLQHTLDTSLDTPRERERQTDRQTETETDREREK